MILGGDFRFLRVMLGWLWDYIYCCHWLVESWATRIEGIDGWEWWSWVGIVMAGGGGLGLWWLVFVVVRFWRVIMVFVVVIRLSQE